MGKVPKPNIVWRPAHPNNFTVGRPGGGRNGQETFHHVVGSAESAVLVFQNPSRGGSAHLVITDRTDVAAWQMVDFNNTAWTDSNWESNLRAITAEHHGDWRNGYRNNQVIENAARVVAWMRDNGLVNHAIRHRQVSRTGTVCPADLPVEEIWNRATEIINHYNNVDNRPDWLKNRKTVAPYKVYSHKDGLYLYNMNSLPNPVDSRRFGINQDFTIRSYVDVGGKRYLFTQSSTDTNAPNGILEDEVKTTPWTAPAPAPVPVAIKYSRLKEPKMYLVKKTPTWLWDLSSGHKWDLKGVKQYNEGDPIEIVGSAKHPNGSTYLMTKFSLSDRDVNAPDFRPDHPWGFNEVDMQVKPVNIPTPTPVPDPTPVPQPEPIPEPQPETPDWVDSIIDIPNRSMWVIRDTLLIDLENGKPVLDKDGKEIWFRRGDEIKDVSAQTIILGKTYILTEYSFLETEAGRWANANGINQDDLSVDRESTHPDPDLGLLKEALAFLQSMVEPLTKAIAKLIEYISRKDKK